MKNKIKEKEGEIANLNVTIERLKASLERFDYFKYLLFMRDMRDYQIFKWVAMYQILLYVMVVAQLLLMDGVKSIFSTSFFLLL